MNFAQAQVLTGIGQQTLRDGAPARELALAGSCGWIPRGLSAVTTEVDVAGEFCQSSQEARGHTNPAAQPGFTKSSVKPFNQN